MLRIYVLSKYKGSQDLLARLFNVAQRLQVRRQAGAGWDRQRLPQVGSARSIWRNNIVGVA